LVTAWLSPTKLRAAALDTETVRVVVPVKPPSSVTVNRTEYVPAAAYVCEGDGCVDVAPSPKVQAYDAMVPSGSEEPELLKLHTNLVQLDVMFATGGRLTGGVVVPAYRNSPAEAQLTPSTEGPLILTLVPLTGDDPFQSMRKSEPSDGVT
jgi:hypothetical protein